MPIQLAVFDTHHKSPLHAVCIISELQLAKRILELNGKTHL